MTLLGNDSDLGTSEQLFSCQLCECGIGKTAELSCHDKPDTDVCHCSRFWLRAESLRYYSPHACNPFPLVEADMKILTRSMRFLHNPTAGSHGREQQRGGRDGEAEMWRRGKQKSLQSRHFSRLGSRQRGEHDAAPLTWNKRRLTWLSLRRCWRRISGKPPCDTFVVVGGKKQRFLELSPWTTALGRCFRMLHPTAFWFCHLGAAMLRTSSPVCSRDSK